MFKLFVSAGPVPMAILTVLLAGVFLAAWKAPRWVKEIGKLALVFGIFKFLLSFANLMNVLSQVAEGSETVTGLFDLISPSLFYMSLKIYLIPVIYGTIIYMISLIIRMLQKPRL